MAKKRPRRGLGMPAQDHIDRAKILVNEAWTDLERMPPTCEGGIALASRALAYVSEAQAHLSSVESRTIREANSELFGLANGASNAAHETLLFFRRTCKAPYRAAADRPSFSRAKFRARVERERKARERKKKRR